MRDWNLCPKCGEAIGDAPEGIKRCAGHDTTPVTMQAVQERFEQEWSERKRFPVSITIHPADYDAFFNSAWPERDYGAFTHELMGEGWIVEQKARRDHAKANMRAVVSLVSQTQALLLRDEKVARGTVVYKWDGDET